MTTSKISKAVSTALMAVAAIGASAGAFAANNPVTGTTDLFIAVWNPSNNNQSFVENLSTIAPGSAGTAAELTSGLFNTPGYSASWNVDNGALASALGSGTYQYQIFAANDASTQAYKGDFAWLSLTAGLPIPSATQNTHLVTNGLISIGNYLNQYLATTNSYTSTSPGAGGDGWLSNIALSPGYDFQMPELLTGKSSASVGNALDLVLYTAINNKASGSTTSAYVGANGGIGSFLLSASGMLTYNAGGASPVPLPPAGWLLISGLLGLLAVGRRRGTEAV